MNDKIDIGIFSKICSVFYSLIKNFFGKKDKIIYINSNKKSINRNDLDTVFSTRKVKYVDCQKIYASKSFFKYKLHFWKMRLCLYNLNSNFKDYELFLYGGFASPMFAVFDGYVISNTIKTNLIGYDNKHGIYAITDYLVKEKNVYLEIPDNINELNILISSSLKINPDMCCNNTCCTIQYTKIINDVITKKDLAEIYNYVKRALDLATQKNVKRINMYISAKQPVTFIVGTAIQTYHPSIYVYELIGNKYSIELYLQGNKLKKVK